MTAPARTAAFRVLAATSSGLRDVPSALANVHTRIGDERDRALTTAIVHGTLRWQRACDHLIEHFSRRRLEALDPAVVVILRLSLYQLLHLDRVPASAVVDDAVDLTRAAGKKSATGFVNAVLRSVLRQRHMLPLPPRPDAGSNRQVSLDYLGITCSHPEWLVARWLDRVGFDNAEQWVRFNNEPAPLTLSVNRLRASRQEVQTALLALDVHTEETRFAPHGLRVVSGNPLRHPNHGQFFVQDEASQLIPLVLDAQPGDRALDLCAAPGGKTVIMSGDMLDTGVIVASDVRARRVALLQNTIRQAGSRHVYPLQIGTTGPLPFIGAFDRVLVDAPCSGLGTVRRDPDIKWSRRESDLPGLAEHQLALLKRAALVVRPGGRLVYATCSSEPEENEQVVDRFLTDEPAFRLVQLGQYGRAEIAVLIDERGLFRSLPFAHGLEAFFAAAMERTAR